MLASGHFQDAIVAPTDVDILVLILWSRLGTPLPERTGVREYKGLDGRIPVTGTEWEFESALAANRSAGAPDLLAYRRSGDPGTSLADPIKRSEQERQWAALEVFWRRHFEDVGLFIAGSARYESIDEFERKLSADLEILIQRRIQALVPSHSAKSPIWLKGSPFRGLTAYDFDSAPIFFGRDAAIATGIARLAQADDRGTTFLLVTGPSGSGKSSLASAGLLPALTAPKAMAGVGGWRRVVFRPGTVRGPIAALADAILQRSQEGVGLPEIAEFGVTAASLEAHLRAAQSDASLPFKTTLGRIGQAQKGLLPHEVIRLVILVDQLEELATNPSVTAEERAGFFRMILGLARSGVIFVVATLRSDFWHLLAADRSFLDLVEAGERIDLTAPDVAEMAEMIRRPAAAAGLGFETDPDTGLPLDALLAKEAAGEGGALPMLSVCLDDLYRRDVDRAGGEATLTIASWRAIGGLRTAIHQRAEEVLGQLAQIDPEAAASLPALLRAAVTAGTSGEAVTARAVPLSTFPVGGPVRRLIEAFLAPDARLLVAEDRGQGPEVRVAHEALIADWARARDWIRDNRRDIETEALLTAMMRRYSAAADDEEKGNALIEGLNLEQGLDLVARGAVAEDSDLAAFIDDSRIEANRVKAREIARAAAMATEKLRQRRRFQFAVLASVAAIVIGALAMFAQTKANTAKLASAQVERAAEIADLETREAAQQAALAKTAEESRIEAVKAQKVAEDAKHLASENEQKALASLKDAQKALVTSLVAQADVDLSRFDVAQALKHALNASEMERRYAKPGHTEDSDAAIWKAIATNRQVLYVRRKSDPWGWPFLFIDNDTLVYALNTGWIVAVDLTRETKVWSVHLDGLEHPFRMTFDAGHGTLAIAGDRKLFVVDVKAPAHPKVFTFQDDIKWFDVDRDDNLVAVAFDHAVTLIDLDGTVPQTTKAIAPDLRDNSLERVVFDRSGSRLYIIDRDRIVEMDVEAGSTHELKLPAKSDIPRLLAEAFDLDAYGEQDQSLIYASDTQFGIFDAAKGTVTDLKAGLTKSLNVSGENYDLPAALHYPDQGKGNSQENLYAVTHSGDQNLLEIGVDLVTENQTFLAEGLLHIPTREFAAHSIRHCRISAEKGYVACRYSQVSDEGLVIWSLGDGALRSARPRLAFNDIDSAARDPDNGRLLLVKGGQLVDAQAPTEPLLLGMAGWRLVAVGASFALLDDPVNTNVMIGTPNVGVMTTLKGRAPVLDAGGRRVYRIDDMSIVAYDAAAAKEVWRHTLDAAPTALKWRRDRLVVVMPDQAIILEAATGVVLHTTKIQTDGSDISAVDASGHKLAYRDVESTLRVADLEGAPEKIIPEASPFPTALAFSPDGATVFVGGYDGIVTAWRLGRGLAWRSPSPLGPASLSRPPADFAQDVRDGQVLKLVPSPDGRMIGVGRAGDDCADLVLQSTETGHELMRITAPHPAMNVTAATFDAEGGLFIDWDSYSVVPSALTDVSAATVDALPQGPDDALFAANTTLARLSGQDEPESPFERH